VPLEKRKGSGDASKQYVPATPIGDLPLNQADTRAKVRAKPAAQDLSQEMVPQAKSQIRHVMVYHPTDARFFSLKKRILLFLIRVGAAP
jgi:hypothetical protein